MTDKQKQEIKEKLEELKISISKDIRDLEEASN